MADHPVVAGMVKIRAYLERIRPLDKRLRYQVDKLLAAASLAQVSTCFTSPHSASNLRLVMQAVVGKLHS